MNPTSFFLLTLLLVLVTETAGRKPREKFSQVFEESSSEGTQIISPGERRGSSSSQDDNIPYEPLIKEEKVQLFYREKKHNKNAGDGGDGDGKSDLELERSYIRKKEKQRFAQEVDK
ncbi:seminal vesicle secretory protein 6-like [Psammomys obesus]|uniref:seminal vesicle secretory protein 6-like n=1 Tax=Psammomys obesus TaxID=48139 RepID=UPI0024533CBE|nr:seminal vesicle secretory protein 6-like [Psammomys obesus]